MRKTLRHMLGIGLVLAIGGGVWAAANWELVRTRYAARQFRNAATEGDRQRWAQSLAATSDGRKLLVQQCHQEDAAVRTTAVQALAVYLEPLDANDPEGTEVSLALLEACAAGEPQRESVAPLLPQLVQRVGGAYGVQCRTAVASALKMASADARIAAIRAAIHPNVGLRAEVVTLLQAPEAEVRRAALFAVGPASDGEAVMGDEELFHWMHDPDADVRSICRAALISRGRTDSEISLGRRLVSPDAGDRLSLLLDLRFDHELVDAEPWLERLSHDPNSGVRAGAARVMMEINGDRMLPAPAWVARLAESDPEPMVRRIAKFYGNLKRDADPEIRLVEGP